MFLHNSSINMTSKVCDVMLSKNNSSPVNVWCHNVSVCWAMRCCCTSKWFINFDKVYTDFIIITSKLLLTSPRPSSSLDCRWAAVNALVFRSFLWGSTPDVLELVVAGLEMLSCLSDECDSALCTTNIRCYTVHVKHTCVCGQCM